MSWQVRPCASLAGAGVFPFAAGVTLVGVQPTRIRILGVVHPTIQRSWQPLYLLRNR